MKLKSFHIINFGGLHDLDYIFDDGLNVILHDNGWGKTTMAAFLKAMLYGFDTKRSRDITENERKRYLPWQGGEYGGSLDFEAEGVNYRIHRTFGPTPRYDETKILDLDKHIPAKIDPEKIGETLFKLDANAFQRSIFITQNGLSIDGAASSIHTRLNTLVSQANDVGAFDSAINTLNQEVKVYEKTGNRGKIGDITKQISEKEWQKGRMAKLIEEQSEARKRIVEIDQSLIFLNDSLAKKKKQLEELSGDLKKKETAEKLLGEIDVSLKTIQEKLDGILRDFGGEIPSSEEVERVKAQDRLFRSLSQDIKQLEGECSELEKEHSGLLSQYDNELPSIKQIDDIQRMYGELQGILSTGKEAIEDEEHPEEFLQITAAMEQDPYYTEKLKDVIGLQDSVSSTVRNVETKENEIQHEAAAWNEKKNSYLTLHSESVNLQKRVENVRQYSPEMIDPIISELEKQGKEERELSQKLLNVTSQAGSEADNWKEKQERYRALKKESDLSIAALQEYESYSEDKINPVIDQLTDLQAKEQSLNLKISQLNNSQLQRNDKMLLVQYPEGRKTYEEGKQILETYHNLSSKKAELAGQKNILAGEISKAESYQSSLDQYSSLHPDTINAVSEPKKSSGMILIGLGVLMLIAGVVLGFMVSKPLFALAVIGIVLAIAGVTNNNKYKEDYQRYQEYISQSKLREENETKRNNLQKQLDDSQSRINTMNDHINGIEDEITADENTVNEWLKQHGVSNKNSEASIRAVMDQAELAGKITEQNLNNQRLEKEIISEKSEIVDGFETIRSAYPMINEKSIKEAIDLLRNSATEYKLRSEKQHNAQKNLEDFLKDNNVTEDQMTAGNSPLAMNAEKTADEIKSQQVKLNESRIKYDIAYPEIEGLSYDQALDLLRKKKADYNIEKTRYDAAVSNETKFIQSSGLEAEQLTAEESPAILRLKQEKGELSAVLQEAIDTCNDVLKSIGLSLDEKNSTGVLRQAGEILRVYNEEAARISESNARNSEKQKQINTLRESLNDKSAVLKDNYSDQDLPARLGLIREDILKEADLDKQIKAKQLRIAEDKKQCEAAKEVTVAFSDSFIRFAPEAENVFTDVDKKLADYNTLRSTLQQTEAQKKSIIEQNNVSLTANNNEAIEKLRYDIQIEENRRDNLRDEYTQKTDLIRQADQAAISYPDILTEIHELYEQKQKAQNRVSMLKHTVQLITKAKENLADRYLSKVEQLFNNYMHIWLDNDAVRGILDIDFNVKIEEDDKIHAAEGYSTGYCDLIDFCMRLALVDTLFEKEQPFLVLDDPFVNLDSDRLNKALELINIMGINKQIIYFVCHPIRAIETNVNDSTRDEYLKLAESTKKMLATRKTTSASQIKAAAKSPRERYQVVSDKGCGVELVKPGRTITNSIFSLDFKVKEGFVKDATYELFFIDEKGHVLNERQILEINQGELSNSRLQFSLNTRDDSGKEYELMIRGSGQGDYEVVDRIPFEAKLAFTGTFAFDF